MKIGVEWNFTLCFLLAPRRYTSRCWQIVAATQKIPALNYSTEQDFLIR